jgi:glycosyltransferase involved in cell wall biosynthesis
MASIVVASFYPAYPFRHGGQRRIFFLSRELARDHAVTVVTLARGGPLKYLEFEPNLTIIRVPAERLYAELERHQLHERNVPPDVTYSAHWNQCRLYQSILRERMRRSSLAISEHPYSLYAIKDAQGDRRMPILYDAHNVEVIQKKVVVRKPAEIMPLIRAMEEEIIADSAALAVCTDFDRDTFISGYAVPADKVVVIGNGVDCAAVPILSAETRQQYRRRLGLDGRFTALFGGSEYPPNIAAVECILSAAAHLPDITFAILGTVCNFPGFRRALPANVLMLGQLSEAEKWLAYVVSDLALNPVVSGSGSNVKMFEYAAAGLPILSTDFGARGTGLRPGEHYYPTGLEDFAARLAALVGSDRAALAQVGAAGQRHVRETSDWQVIGQRYRALVADLIGGR